MAEEKIKAAEVMSDDELDGVAGGTHAENVSLLNMMLQLDPKATQDFLKGWDQQSEMADFHLANGVTGLVNNYVKGMKLKDTYMDASTGVDNLYTLKGKRVSKEEFMNYLNPEF